MHKKHSSFIANLQKPSFLSILPLIGYGISLCLFFYPIICNSLFQPNSLVITKVISDPIDNVSKQIRLVIIKANDYEVKYDRLAFSGNWQHIVYENSHYLETRGNNTSSVSVILPFDTYKLEIWFASGPNEGKVNIALNGFNQQISLNESENGERLALFPNTTFVLKQLLYFILILLLASSILFLLLFLLKIFFRKPFFEIYSSFLIGFLPGLFGACLAISFSMSSNTLSIFNRGYIYQKIVLCILIFISSLLAIFICRGFLFPFLKRLSSRNFVFLLCASSIFAIANYLKYYSNNLRIEFFFIHFIAFFFIFLLFITLLIVFYDKCIKVLPVYSIICIFIVVLIYFLLLTQGRQGNLFIHDHLGIDTGYYDYLGRSILRGKLDVPPNVIAEEAFVYNDKTYGYFGIAPALLRLPVNWLFPDLFGKWTSMMLLAACFSNQIFAFLIIKQFISIWKIPKENTRTKLMIGLFLLITGLGTTNIFLTRPSVYVEASMLGSSFALAFFYYFLIYLYKPTSSYLLLISALCFLTFHTRQTSGLGVFVALGLFVFFFILNRIRVRIFKILPEKTNLPSTNNNAGISETSNVHILIIVFVVLFSGLLQVGMNYYRFGTLFDSTPFDHYIAFKESP